MLLEHARWPDLPALSKRIFIVPLGSMEQHGRHLPLSTDSLIISDIAHRVEELCAEQIVMLPGQWLGHSPHHRRFGCVSLDLTPYVEMIRGICRSLVEMGARRILLLNGHGGNEIPCKAALRELKSEFESLRDLYIVFASYWSLAAEEFNSIRESPEGGMGHACEMETSMLLSRHPELVERGQLTRGGPAPERGYITIDMLKSQPFYMVNEFDEFSETGVIGMPDFADEAKGERFLEAAAQGVERFLKQFASWDFQTRSAQRPT